MSRAIHRDPAAIQRAIFQDGQTLPVIQKRCAAIQQECFQDGHPDSVIQNEPAAIQQEWDITAGGVMQAVTAYAQTVGDADDAYNLEMST